VQLAYRGDSEFEDEPPPRVTADVGVGVHDLLTVPGEFEEGVRVYDRVELELVGEAGFVEEPGVGTGGVGLLWERAEH
jgi:hypothetical protein